MKKELWKTLGYFTGIFVTISALFLAGCGSDSSSTPAGFTVTTASLPAATINTAYPTTTLAASGGTAPYTWTWAAATGSTLPAGLNLSTAGIITGTPTALGTSNVIVTVTDSATPAHTATMPLSITVAAAAAGTLTITPTTLPGATAGTAYTPQTLTATGGTGAITWAVTAGTLAPLALAPTTGVISGTPTTAGTLSFTVTATDSSTPAKTGTQALTITVAGAAATLAVTTASLPVEVLGTAYSQTLAATGATGAITWSVTGTLPAGLTLAPATGVIAGTPTVAANASFTVTATDSATPAHTATSPSLTITSFTAAGVTAYTANGCNGCHGTLTPGTGVSGTAIAFPSSLTAFTAALGSMPASVTTLNTSSPATVAAIIGAMY